MAGGTINDQIMDALSSLNTNKNTSNSMKADLDLQTVDWMTLLVAQLKHQDMNNSVDTNQMMSQLSQFSELQAIQNMVSMQENIFAMNTTSYAASLMGKEVTVAEIKTVTDSDGKKEELVTTKGVVTGVTLFEGVPMIYIGDKKFSLAQIMIVGDVPTEEKPDDGEGGDVEKPDAGGDVEKPDAGGDVTKPDAGEGGGDTTNPDGGEGGNTTDPKA